MQHEITLNLNVNIRSPESGEVLRLLKLLLQRQETEMAVIDDIQSDVADESTVIDGVVTLLTNLSAQLAAAGTDPAKLQAIKDAIDSNKKKLADAVVANTPATPAP